ncbi:hypothetical protein AOLI_G00146010 [Acnodon oligacanthus]
MELILSTLAPNLAASGDHQVSSSMTQARLPGEPCWEKMFDELLGCGAPSILSQLPPKSQKPPPKNCSQILDTEHHLSP